MPSLSKILRNVDARRFLDRLLALAEPGTVLGLFHGDAPVCTVGAPGLEKGAPGVLLVPIVCHGASRAELALLPPDGGDADRAAALLDFGADALRNVFESECGRRAVADEALAKYRELALLSRSVAAFNDSLRLKDVTAAFLDEARTSIASAEMGVVYLLEPTSGAFRPIHSYGFAEDTDLSMLPAGRIFQDVAASGKGEIVNRLERDRRWNQEIEGLGSMLIVPIISPKQCEGVLVLGAAGPGPFHAAHLKNLSLLTSVAAISVSNAFHFESIQVLMDALLQALAEAIDSRDPFTAGHSQRVAQLAVAFCRVVEEDTGTFAQVRFTDQEIREIYYAGILHDVGKIGIKEDVLTKDTRLPERLLEIIKVRLQLYGMATDFDWQGAFDRLRAINQSVEPVADDLVFVQKLSDMSWRLGDRDIPLLKEDETQCLLVRHGNLTVEERREIQRHPVESQRILEHIPFQQGFCNLLTIIRQHHERLNGSGYPDGIMGDEIILQSRMLAIVDIYDAITQERHYKPAASRQEALMLLDKEVSEGKLDAELVSLFRENLDEIEGEADSIRMRRLQSLVEFEGYDFV